VTDKRERPTKLPSRYLDANHYLNEGLIRLAESTSDATATLPKERGPNDRNRRQWMEWFLPYLDHPEKAWPAIHIGGTSGKGSVSAMVAEILNAANINTGLHVSPYVQVATEKLWANGRYASAEEFAQLVDWIRPICESLRTPELPLHGMASVAIALEFYRRRKVELGVMEVGVGGRNDLTNVMETCVAVVGKVGYDHLRTLGPTLEDIAWHKAGIIKEGCHAVVLAGPGLAAATKQAKQVGAKLRIIREENWRQCPPVTTHANTNHMDYRGTHFQLEGVELAMKGSCQAENAALAIATIEALIDQGWSIDENAIRLGLGRAKMPARAETMPQRKGCMVVVDGAHNADKIRALSQAIGEIPHRNLFLVYGGLHHHPPADSLFDLARKAEQTIITAPTVYAKQARPAAETAADLRVAGIPSVHAVDDAEEALNLGLQSAGEGDLLVVTGSLYLAGQLRGRWYPAERVLETGTSWPALEAVKATRR
jgi:dihydrofolate synthase / folylpolyglutamate synthase